MHKIQTSLEVFKNVEYGLIDCIREICEGQQMDMGFEERNNVTEEQYTEMIRKKTAVLFQYSSEAGAILGECTKEQENALNQYGLSLGLGFQIWDDYLDISSNKEILGKDIGNDIRNGKKTLIAVHSINSSEGKEKKQLEQIFGNRNATEEDIKNVYRILEKTGSIEYAKKTALKYIDEAKESIQILPDSDAKQILMNLADYAIKRKK